MNARQQNRKEKKQIILSYNSERIEQNESKDKKEFKH